MSKRAVLFKPYLSQILALGYRVFVHQEETYRSWCIIADEQGRIGYCQLGDYGNGVRLGTKHKPCEECGTGFSMTDWDNPVMQIERSHCEQALAFAPDWATPKQRAAVKKWTLDEYLASFWGKNLVEYEAED